MANTRTITTVKQPYDTSDGTKLYLGTSTEVEVDNNGKYVPNSATISLRLYTGGILGADYVVVGTRKSGETWQLEKDGNNNYVAGLDLQKTLANRNSMLNINLNSHVSRALGAPLQGVPAGQVNTNSQSSSNAALGLPAPGSSPDLLQSGVPLELQEEIKSDYIEENYDDMIYPIELRNNGQDYIKFSTVTYGRRSISPSANSNSFTPGIGNRTEKTINGSVTLPIQPSITDINTVQWGGEDLNAISAFTASLSYSAMSDRTKAVDGLISQVEERLRDQSTSPAVKLYLAGKAVGVNGLLSRVGGAVLNPNLELLFQGPQLRPFNFNFRLSPRSEPEATQVRKIIRYFKQNMSVKTTADNIFLKAPNVFDIKYVKGKSRDRNGKIIDPHPSLNLIKRCALVSCSVDYTPDGTYMTFADANATMTSYNITLQFQELEPVTERDYKPLTDKSIIGY